MKKVLILTVTAGNGHNSAANAMKNKLEQNGQVEVKVVDIIKEYTSSFNSWIIDKGFSFAVGHLRGVYTHFYTKYLKYNINKSNTCPAQVSVKSLNGELLKLIYDFKPDVIYSTIYYGGMALTNLKRVYDLPSKNIVCMLDYVVSPFWEASVGGVDFMTLAHEDFRQELIQKGFENDNLIYTGIPISDKFVKVVDKTEAREKLGLEKDLFTVFILYGGGHMHGGYEVLKTLVKNIKKKIQIVIVNGKDEKIKAKIDKELADYPKNIIVKNIGFSKEIDLIMSASDIMIGKGGGLCTTESINKTLPLISTKKLPGQEIYNIKFLEDKGLSRTFNNSKDLVKIINHFYDNPDELNKIRLGLLQLKTNGIELVYDLIMQQPNADYFGINTKLDYNKVDKIVNRARKKTNKEKIKKGKK